MRHNEVREIREKFTVATEGSAPYAQQIVNKLMALKTQVFRLIYRQFE
jgi:hypothetical protein